MSERFERLSRATPARLDQGRAGPRPRTASALDFRADHARARDAVHGQWSETFLRELESLGFLLCRSAAADKPSYLLRPDLGRQLAAGEPERIRAHARPGALVQVVVSDGLSARAAQTQLPRIWPVLVRGLERLGPLARPVALRLARVALADRVCEASGAPLAVHLIGERPGLANAESLGCYFTWQPGPETTDAERNCLSNIHARGLAPDEAGAAIAEIAGRIARARRSGLDLG